MKAAEAPVKDARLLVTVTKEEKVLFGERDVTGKVAQAFRESARVQKERELYIRADKDARYGIVAEVVAAARNSGVESLNLLVQPELEEVTEEPATPEKKPPRGAAPGIPPGPGPSQK